MVFVVDIDCFIFRLFTKRQLSCECQLPKVYGIIPKIYTISPLLSNVYAFSSEAKCTALLARVSATSVVYATKAELNQWVYLQPFAFEFALWRKSAAPRPSMALVGGVYEKEPNNFLLWIQNGKVPRVNFEYVSKNFAPNTHACIERDFSRLAQAYYKL